MPRYNKRIYIAQMPHRQGDPTASRTLFRFLLLSIILDLGLPLCCADGQTA